MISQNDGDESSIGVLSKEKEVEGLFEELYYTRAEKWNGTRKRLVEKLFQ